MDEKEKIISSLSEKANAMVASFKEEIAKAENEAEATLTAEKVISTLRDDIMPLNKQIFALDKQEWTEANEKRFMKNAMLNILGTTGSPVLVKSMKNPALKDTVLMIFGKELHKATPNFDATLIIG
jgi:hypothetical protein